MNSKVHILINMKEYVLLKLIQEKKLMSLIMRSQHGYNTSCFKIIQFFHFFLLLKLLHIFPLYHMLWSCLTSICYKFPSKLSCLNSHFILLIDSVSQEFRLSWEWLLFSPGYWGLSWDDSRVGDNSTSSLWWMMLPVGWDLSWAVDWSFSTCLCG